MIPIILLTLEQIQNMKRENHEFAVCLLLLVHSGCVIFSMISTSLFCRITDALLTTLTIILLSAYTGIHYYIRFMFDHHYYYSKNDFITVTLRLGFVLIMLIILLPWTNIMTHSYRINIMNENVCSQTITFFWFLKFDSMLIISLLTLNIRTQADFNRFQLFILFIGLLFVFLWLIIGKILANNKSRHWIIWTIFYILAIIHIIYLAYIIYWSKFEYDLLMKTNETSLISLLIQTFICSCINILIHVLLIIISFSLCCSF